MKNIINLLVALFCFGCGSVHARSDTNIVDLRKKSKKEFLQLKKHLETGDLIFQYTNTRVARVTESIENSPITHVGIVIREGNRVRVFEASSKVKFTSLKKFLLKSKNGWFAIMTPKQKLTDKQIEEMVINTRKWNNKSYDSKFSWTDEKIYCTELAYKMYEQVGVKISNLEKMSEFLKEHSENTIMEQYIKKVHGSKKNINQREYILTPLSLFQSDKLTLVTNHYTWEDYDTFPYYEDDFGGP